MATGTVLLPSGGAELDATNPPGVSFVNSRRLLLFDAQTDEIIYYTFRMPQDYASAPALKVQYSAVSATSGTAAWSCEVMAVTDGEDVDTDSYDTINTGSGTVPGTAGLMDEVSITLTNADSAAAGDYVALKIRRDVSEDSVSGDLEFWSAALEYTTS